jgi:hypothetical protein
MALSERDILDVLNPSFERADIPDDAYEQSLRFHGFPSIYNTVEKHAILKCVDVSYIDSIILTIRTTLDTSYAYRTDSPPPAPVPADIDMLPLSNPPRYCQIRSCTFHNNRRDVFPDTPHGLHAAESHGVHLHHDIYTTLTTSELASISWLRCCDLCPTIHINRESMSQHQSRCIRFNSAQYYDSSTASANQHSRTGRFAQLYLACPPNRTRNLDDIINENPHSDTTTLLAIVNGWRTTDTSNQDDSPAATAPTQP